MLSRTLIKNVLLSFHGVKWRSAKMTSRSAAEEREYLALLSKALC